MAASSAAEHGSDARAAQPRRARTSRWRAPTCSASTWTAWPPGTRVVVDERGLRLARAAACRSCPGGRLLRAGRAESLRDLPPGRRARAQAAAGQGRGAAVGDEARQPVFHAGARAHRSRASGEDGAGARSTRSRRSRRRPIRSSSRHIRIRSELLSRFWGRDVYLGAHVLRAEGLRQAPGGALPADGLPRPLSRKTSRTSAPRRRTRT